MKRFELRLDAELQYEASQITSLRERAQIWMDKAEIFHLKGDESSAVQALTFAASFAKVADTRAKALLAW